MIACTIIPLRSELRMQPVKSLTALLATTRRSYGRLLPPDSRLAYHVSHITHHVSRITYHASLPKSDGGRPGKYSLATLAT
jgi:hypothetical protein